MTSCVLDWIFLNICDFLTFFLNYKKKFSVTLFMPFSNSPHAQKWCIFGRSFPFLVMYELSNLKDVLGICFWQIHEDNEMSKILVCKHFSFSRWKFSNKLWRRKKKLENENVLFDVTQSQSITFLFTFLSCWKFYAKSFVSSLSPTFSFWSIFTIIFSHSRFKLTSFPSLACEKFEPNNTVRINFHT